MNARKTQPTKRTTWNDQQSFRVWAEYRSFDEDPKPWKCVAMFDFLLDALDYIAIQQYRGATVVFQSPGDDCRVYSPDTKSARPVVEIPENMELV